MSLVKFRSSCPVSSYLDIFGDKWTILVIRDLFLGKTKFGELQKTPENIQTNILADRLKKLENSEIIKKKPYQEKPVRYCYELTNKGRSLAPVLKSMVEWSKSYNETE